MYAQAFATTSQVDFREGGDIRAQTDIEGGYQSLLERDVVVRRLRPGPAASPRSRNRFIKEVQALASLHHHHFVRVYDAGMLNEIPFAVFERLRGVTAQERISLLFDRGAKMDIDEAVRIVRGVAEGVAYARRNGVRVYDLTPDNIVLTNDGRVVLTGLGEPLPDNPLTAPAIALAYAPPEQLFGTPSEGESEVYGLGVLLAHLVFGRLPYEGTAIGIVAQKQQSNSLPLLEDPHLSMACPYPLARVIHRATTFEPGERYPSVEMFRTALLEVVSGPSRKTQTLPFRARPVDDTPLFDEEPYTGSYKSRVRAPAAHATAQRAAQCEDRYENTVQPQRLHVLHPKSSSTVPVVPVAPIASSDASPTVIMAAPLMAEGASTPATAEPVEGVVIVQPEVYDPLLPGLDMPTLQAALPFTVLVPMPSDETSIEALSTAAPRRNVLPTHYALVFMVLCVLAITTAMMFG